MEIDPNGGPLQAVRLVNKSSGRLPAASAALNHCGCLPIPPQVLPPPSRNFVTLGAGLPATLPFSRASTGFTDLAPLVIAGPEPRSEAVNP